MIDELKTYLRLAATARIEEATMKRKAARELVEIDGRSAESDALFRGALADVRAAAQMLLIGGFLEELPPGKAA